MARSAGEIMPTSRNLDIKQILASREIAEEQRKRIRATLKKRKHPQYLENTYVRSSLWPKNRRSDA